MPGPLDNLPRPLADRERRGRSGLRRFLAVGGVGAMVAAVVMLAAPTATAPISTIGVVAGAAATGRSDDESGRPMSSLAPEPTLPPTGIGAVHAPRSSESGPDGGEIGAPLPASLTGYRWPIKRIRVTLPFGPSPWGSRSVDGANFHDGIDLATFCGDRIVAAHDGTVLAAGRHYDRFMGWIGDLDPYFARLDRKHAWKTLPIVVIIDDGNGYRSIYAHFGKITVTKGDVVEAGDLIGYEGATGRASGCHLHYGLFSPLDDERFEIDRDVRKRMKLPRYQTARIDPTLVLPDRGSAGD